MKKRCNGLASPRHFASLLLTSSLLVGGLPNSALAGIYKWVDENGKTHFSNVPPQLPSKDSTVEALDLKVAPPDRENAYRIKRLYNQSEYEREREEREKERALRAVERERKSERNDEEYRQEQCEKYRERYVELRDKDSVKAIHPITGNVIKFTGDSVDKIRDDVKENRDLFCD